MSTEKEWLRECEAWVKKRRLEGDYENLFCTKTRKCLEGVDKNE